MRIDEFENIYILTKKKFFKFYEFSFKKVTLIDNLELFNNQNITNTNSILISCNTNLIVSEKIFKKFNLSINIHPGSHLFPGRDPHHWACYGNATFFGSTVHIMEKKVDSGKILDFEYSKIFGKLSPFGYQKIANNTSLILMKRILEALHKGFILVKNENWNTKINKRIDILKMCNFKGLDAEEIKKRKFSFQGFEKFFLY